MKLPETEHHESDQRRDASTRPHEREAGMAELFERWVRRTPEALAVVADGEPPLTYAELDDRAERVAQTLAEHGVEAGKHVGVLGHRRLDALVATLGIVKAGCVYVPLDAALSERRLAVMAVDARLCMVLEGPDAHCSIAGLPVLRAADRTGPAVRRPSDTVRKRSGEDLAYIMFTSGSTGRPKAVAVRNRGIAHLVVDTDYVHIAPYDRVLHSANQSFDASTFELWGALLNGACLVVADPYTLLSPKDLQRLLSEHGVTVALLTAAIFHRIAAEAPDTFGSLDQLLVGGDVLSPRAARDVLACRRPPRRLVNGYGPTESTVFSTAFHVREVPPGAMAIPIGTPIAHTTCYVLRTDGTLADVGEKGELCVGGDRVAAGYLNDPLLTEERFIPDPFADDPAARLYRTGDIASRRDDGIFEYHGRTDTQFKIHGHRVEASEIENALREHSSVADAAVVLCPLPGAEDVEIVAYTVADKNGGQPSVHELHDHVAAILPSYMIPSLFVWLDEIPLTEHGKADRAAPPPPDRTPAHAAPPPTAPLIDRVRALWQEVLAENGIEEDIGPDDTLFDVGSTSFDVPRIHDAVTAQLSVPQLTPLDAFAYPTLRKYTDHLAGLLKTSQEQEETR